MDLIGTRKLALDGNRAASKKMRAFHKLVRREMTAGLRSLDHAYLWNDSVLLLAYVNHRPHTYENALHSVDDLKRKVDLIARCYAIAVKGQVFPINIPPADARVTVIEASSYAMANCFRIEKQAKTKKRRNDWYVDVRIAGNVRRARTAKWIAVSMLPSGKCRRVYTHDGYLWKDA